MSAAEAASTTTATAFIDSVEPLLPLNLDSAVDLCGLA
jgi:hypothetical protein